MSTGLILGFFDGVHKAHRAVIESALKESDNVVLITFKESPAVYFGKSCEYILSRENSIKKIKNLGVNEIVELDFSKIVSLSAEEYIEFLVNKYHPSYISTGFNHTFGFNKQGNSKFLKEKEKKYHYKYICTPPVIEDGEIISSTLIRKYLSEGKIQKANKLSENNFILEGDVIHGARIGRTIGFPTANINYPANIVKIPFGVYAAEVQIAGAEKLRGVMNWGMKPTVNNTNTPVAEVHILDFNEDIYGKNIKVEVLRNIRMEKRFNGIEDLKVQIKEDIRNCSEL